jgi:HAD superfamily hydrolase (TIGR01509 family)
MIDKLLIFDCDGVLIDSEIIACRVDAEALTAIGIAMTTEEVIRQYAGISQKDMRAMIEAKHGISLPPDFEVEAERRAHKMMAAELRAMPGMKGVIASIAGPYCIASSSTYEKLRHTLGLTGIYDLFVPNIFSSSEVARGKPAPDLFLFASRRMDAEASACVVVEDSVAGVSAARAAGMRAIGFVGGAHCLTGHAERLKQAGAETVVDRLDDLRAVIPEYFRPAAR